MISTFIVEQKRYTSKDLKAIFQNSNNDILYNIINKLKEFGILKIVKNSDIQKDLTDLIDKDIEITDINLNTNDFLYVCTFVGVIIISGYVLKCYPKYFLTETKEPKSELKQIFNVLKKYNNSKEQIIHMFNDTYERSSFNLISLILFLLQDYYENGVYNNSESIIENNGMNEILWDKTINETFAFINNNQPFYFNLKTKRNVDDETNYFKKLHECILTLASKELLESDLLNLFELSEVELSHNNISDFGEKEYILHRIENELNLQFNTRKQLVLKMLYIYISKDEHLHDIKSLSMFGTNTFNLVWESVCAKIFNNQLQRSISSIEALKDIDLKEEYKNKKLIDIIEKPKWSCAKQSNDTLIPDIISITKKDNNIKFIILDAKYYNIKLEKDKEPKSQPGIQDITKQYLYQLAYKKFLEDCSITQIENYFLFPTTKETIDDKGVVYMDMFRKLNLQDIKIKLLPVTKVFEYYLKNTTLDITELSL